MGGKTGGAPGTSNDEGGGGEKKKLVEDGAGKDTQTLFHVGGREGRRRGFSIQEHDLFLYHLILTCEAIFQSAGVRGPERGRHREENGWEEGAGEEKAGISPSSDSSMTRLCAWQSEKEEGRLVRSENTTRKKKICAPSSSLSTRAFPFSPLTFPPPVSASSSSPAARPDATTS